MSKREKHGYSNTKIYGVWKAMKERCFNPHNKRYKHYMGKGITVCSEWLVFSGFIKDMGPTYKPGLTLERKNVNGNYCLENCCWDTRSVQANNMTTNRIIDTPWGKLNIKQASVKAGISAGVLRYRVEANWPYEKLFIPPIFTFTTRTI